MKKRLGGLCRPYEMILEKYRNKRYLLVWFLVINGLVSCSFPTHFGGLSAQQEEIKQQYKEVSALLTQTAQVTYDSMTLPAGPSTPAQTLLAPTATEIPFNAPPSIPALAATQELNVSDGKAIAAPCDLAQLGFPLDINVPDGSQFQPEEMFSKTWRLYNAGSCTWTADYTVVWFSGKDMGLNEVQPLNMEVLPGGLVDVTVDMVAPSSPGTYQSNWKLRNRDGVLFGIGPNGDAPFWVRIVVVPVGTPTVIPTVPSATPTPVIYSSGSLTLLLGEKVDLDSAQINQAENDDLGFQSAGADEIELVPMTGTHLAAYGPRPPQIIDCEQASADNAPAILAQEQTGMYYCYRTTKGLPGWILIKSVDLENGQVDLEFVTWVVP